MPRYEQDLRYKSFVQDKDFMYYSYFMNTQINGLQEKRGTYKIKADGSNMAKLSDKPAWYMNLYKDYIYYINYDELRIYRMKTDGSGKAKICEINGVLKYIKDDYIYYTMVDKGTKDLTQFMHDIGYISKVKLNGIKPIQLTDEQVPNFVIDNNDIYYYQIDAEKGDNSNVLYRVNSEGKYKTKVADNIFMPLYITNDKVNYIDHDSYLPYRKDIKSSKEILLL